MSLSDLASLGSFVSGLAVVVSLVFLYFQVRQVNHQVQQTEKNQRATIAQVRAGRTADVILRATDPSMAAALRKAFAGAEITPSELQQFVAFVRAYLVNYEDTFLQHRHGMLEEGAFGGFVSLLRANMSNPSFRVAWRMQHNIVGAEFAAFLDQLVAETPMRPAVSAEAFLAEWKQGWAELTQAAH